MKPGAGQGSPLRVAPLYRAILVKIITCLGLVPYTTVAASPRSSTLRLRAFSGHRPCNTSRPRVVLGSCVAAGACFGRVALGRPGSGTAIQRGADVGGVVVAVAAAGEGRCDVVDVFL